MSTDARSVVILGAGGHARVLVEALRSLDVEIAGFIAPSAGGSRLGDIPWLGSDDALSTLGGEVDLVNGVGSAGQLTRRAAAYNAADAAGMMRFRTIIHPHAFVDGSAEIRAGAQILAGALVGVGVQLSFDVIVNSGAIVDHDSRIGAHSHVAPGTIISGDVVIGESTHVGLGARIIQGVTIGSSCVIGAGAVVLKDVPDGTTVVGVPAHPLSAARRR